MKKIFFCCLTMSVCMLTAFSAAAQGTTRNVSGYNGIECNGPFNVQIKIDGTESLKLDVDAAILNDIETEVEGGTLKVHWKHGWRNHGDVKRANIYITAKQLNYLANGGSGNMVLEGAVTGTDAKVSVSGSGSIKASVKSDALELRASGSGSLTLNGSTGSTEARISGSGGINAKGVTTRTINARISGSGGVRISASETVSASISGSGGLQYSGNASVTSSHSSGSGRVTKSN